MEKLGLTMGAIEALNKSIEDKKNSNKAYKMLYINGPFAYTTNGRSATRTKLEYTFNPGAYQIECTKKLGAGIGEFILSDVQDIPCPDIDNLLATKNVCAIINRTISKGTYEMDLTSIILDVYKTAGTAISYGLLYGIPCGGYEMSIKKLTCGDTLYLHSGNIEMLVMSYKYEEGVN